MGKFMWKLKNSPIGTAKCRNSIYFVSQMQTTKTYIKECKGKSVWTYRGINS